MSVIARVAAVRVGRIQTYPWRGRDEPSACAKHPAAGPVWLGPLGLDGDDQADKANHGGPEKAILLYAGQHYPRWRADEGLDLPEGALFENITLAGPDGAPAPDEATIRLGETWRIGAAVVLISQPRSPCYKLAQRWGIPDFVERVHRTGWTGWYARVLTPGLVAVGDAVERLSSDSAQPTLAEISRVVNVDQHDLDGARRLLGVADLPERWRAKLTRRLGGEIDDDSARLHGTPPSA